MITMEAPRLQGSNAPGSTLWEHPSDELNHLVLNPPFVRLNDTTVMQRWSGQTSHGCSQRAASHRLHEHAGTHPANEASHSPSDNAAVHLNAAERIFPPHRLSVFLHLSRCEAQQSPEVLKFWFGFLVGLRGLAQRPSMSIDVYPILRVFGLALRARRSQRLSARGVLATWTCRGLCAEVRHTDKRRQLGLKYSDLKLVLLPAADRGISFCCFRWLSPAAL